MKNILNIIICALLLSSCGVTRYQSRTLRLYDDLGINYQVLKKPNKAVGGVPTKAAYLPKSDLIQIKGSVVATNNPRTISTLLHELAHWTGHPTRLDRPTIRMMASGVTPPPDSMFIEECVAKMTAYRVAELSPYLKHKVTKKRAERYLDHHTQAFVLSEDQNKYVSDESAKAAQFIVDTLAEKGFDLGKIDTLRTATQILVGVPLG